MLITQYRREHPEVSQDALGVQCHVSQSLVSRADASNGETQEPPREPRAENILAICEHWPEGRLDVAWFFATQVSGDRRDYLRSRKPHEALEAFRELAPTMGYGKVTDEEFEQLAEQRWPGKPTPKSYADLLSAMRACEPPLHNGNGRHHSTAPPHA